MPRIKAPLCPCIGTRMVRLYVRHPSAKGWLPIGWFCPDCFDTSLDTKTAAAQHPDQQTLDIEPSRGTRGRTHDAHTRGGA